MFLEPGDFWKCVDFLTYLDDGLLTFDSGLETRLGDFDVQIFALHVGGDGSAEVDIANGLRPFVRQLALLVLLLLLRFLVQTLALLWSGRRRSLAVGHLVVCSRDAERIRDAKVWMTFGCWFELVTGVQVCFQQHTPGHPDDMSNY